MRSGSLVAYDFIQVGEFLKTDESFFISQPPYFDEIQFHTVESIQAFIEYCDQTAPHEGESTCFLLGNTDLVSLYYGQQEAYYHREDYQDYTIQEFGHQYYFTRTRTCGAGARCAFREYTTFLRDSKVDVKIVVYVLLDLEDRERQAPLSDKLFTSFHMSFSHDKNGLTLRVADLRESARFSGWFATLSFFRFDGNFALRPQTTNAHGWAVLHEDTSY